MSSLLVNAVVSIQLGLEDFASEDERRVVSAARNVYAGVLLLCKEVLQRLSPPGSSDVLIRVKKKAARGADGFARLVGDGKRTIGRAEIEERFKELSISVDLSKLKRLADIRNDIEHMYPIVGPALIQEAISDAMPIIRSIIVSEFHEEPSVLLGADAWAGMLRVATVFSEEHRRCRATLTGVDWRSDSLRSGQDELRCPSCRSSLLLNVNPDAAVISEIELLCSHCGNRPNADLVIENALAEILFGEAHEAAKEGGVSPVANCPGCGLETFVVSEDQCVICEFSLDGRECDICGQPIDVDEFEIGRGSMCSYHANLFSKDD